MRASQVALMAGNLPANARGAGDLGSILGWGTSSGGGNGNPLQCSCLENFIDRGSWWAIVHGVTKSCIQRNNRAHVYSLHFPLKKKIAGIALTPYGSFFHHLLQHTRTGLSRWKLRRNCALNGKAEGRSFSELCLITQKTVRLKSMLVSGTALKVFSTSA